MAKQNIDLMARKDFEKLLMRKWGKDVGKFSSLVILPTRRKHDSGYACMDFVAVNDKDIPLCRLSGCSDVIHINGIGGLGPPGWSKRYKGFPRTIEPVSWSIDCLHKSKLLRLFASPCKLSAGKALSSFEIYAEPIKENDNGPD